MVVPDFLSGKGPDGGGTASLGGDAGQAIRKLTEAEITARVAAALAWGRALPNANGKGAVLGFCWGGTQSFLCAIELQDLQAAVVFYGSAPGATATTVPGERIARIAAPVLGCYGGNDARINATLGPTIAAMLEHGKPFEFHSFEGAGHGFTRNQAAAGGANRRAVQFAWPLALAFLRRHL